MHCHPALQRAESSMSLSRQRLCSFKQPFKDLERAVGFQPSYYVFLLSQGFSTFDWSESAGMEAEDILDNLIHDIDVQFAIGEASARDQDKNGKTLLHVSTS